MAAYWSYAKAHNWTCVWAKNENSLDLWHTENVLSLGLMSRDFCECGSKAVTECCAFNTLFVPGPLPFVDDQQQEHTCQMTLKARTEILTSLSCSRSAFSCSLYHELDRV